MGRPSERKARREPRGRTSAEIVDAILKAASELLAEKGLVGVTTNHVAERAGVSIGSLYRYFPDKESIIAALDLRIRRQAAVRFQAALADFQTDFPGAVRRALRAFMEGGPPPALRAALMREVPAAWVLSNARQVWAEVVSTAAAKLAELRPELDRHDAECRVFFAIHATQGITNGLALWPREDLDPEAIFQLLAEHLTAILLAPPAKREAARASEAGGERDSATPGGGGPEPETA